MKELQVGGNLHPDDTMGWEFHADSGVSLIKLMTPEQTLHFGNDDKQLTPFIRCESDFIGFASVLAQTHGLYIKMVPKNQHNLTCMCIFTRGR